MSTRSSSSSEGGCSVCQPGKECTGMDFFILLPPELVLCIIFYLPLRQFFACLAVSKTWRRLLSEMEPYWRRACDELGLSRDFVAKLLSHDYSSSREVIFHALRHRHSIWMHKPKPRQFSDGYPYYMHYICHHMKRDHMVGTVYRNFHPYKILVQRLQEETVQTVVLLCPTYPLITENRIIWAHIYREQNLFCAAASGVWSVYDITSKSGCVTLQWRAEPMYDPEIKFACCDKCSIVCTAKLIVSHLEESFWELRIIEVLKKPSESTKKRLPMPSVTRFKLEAKNIEITSRRNGFGKKRVILLSRSSKSTTSGFCSSHLVLVQWANIIEGHMIRYRSLDERSPLLITQSLDINFEVECSKSNYDEAIMRNHGLNTEFSLTEDKTRLGVIFQSYLTTWEINSSILSSRAPVTLESYNYEEMKLIALGHIYSIVGLEFNNSLIVLATRTGQKLLVCDNFARQHCSMVPPYIVFFSSVGEDWLSDISQPCWSRVLYWNKTNRCIEGVELGQQPASSESQSPATVTKNKKKHWWQRNQQS